MSPFGIELGDEAVDVAIPCRGAATEVGAPLEGARDDQVVRAVDLERQGNRRNPFQRPSTNGRHRMGRASGGTPAPGPASRPDLLRSRPCLRTFRQDRSHRYHRSRRASRPGRPRRRRTGARGGCRLGRASPRRRRGLPGSSRPPTSPPRPMMRRTRRACRGSCRSSARRCCHRKPLDAARRRRGRHHAVVVRRARDAAALRDRARRRPAVGPGLPVSWQNPSSSPRPSCTGRTRCPAPWARTCLPRWWSRYSCPTPPSHTPRKRRGRPGLPKARCDHCG